MTSGINTREMILEILLQINEEGEHSHIAIRNALSKYQFLPKQERAFITRVCEGTLEYRILIDYIIRFFFKDHSRQNETADQRNPEKCSISAEIYGQGTGQCRMQ